MSLNFRDDLVKASEKQFEAQIDKHRINIEILLENTVGVAEHPDIMETIEKELGIISEYITIKNFNELCGFHINFYATLTYHYRITMRS